MLSNIHVLIFAVVWACLSTETSAEALCGNKLSVGEIRVLNSRRCVNIFGTNGQGYMDTYECDGYDDQQLIFCGDGTIRNLAAPQNCATPCGTSSTDGEGRVYSVPCERLPSIPDYQKWDRIVQKSFVDDWGIRQVVYTFRNRKSGKCLDVNGHDGIGRLKTHSCHDRPDQSFYFRSRGKLLVRGRLQNEKSGLCMDNNFDSKFIKLNICHDIPSQYFRFYANGELLNDNERLCVDVSKRDGTGNLRLDDCADQSYQIWSRPKHYCNTDYCPFVNKRSQYCTNTGGYAAKYRQVLNARKCDGGSDQRYKWLIKKQKPASAKWAIIGCNQNGGISHTIHDTVISRSGAEISEAVSKSVAATIEAGVEFHETSLNIPVTSTLANTWSSNRLRTRKSLTFTCKTYDSGKPFRRGCMWRLVVSVKKANNNGLVWKSLIVKCTSSHKEPTCPPFTKCTNSACTKCEDLPRKRSLTSNGGKSFLKKSIQNK